jgi:histidine triad (HIT) family protein
MATDPSCVFCKIAKGELPAKVVHQTERVVAFEDLNPAAPCHVLVIPKEHIRTVNDIEPEHYALVGELFAAAKEVAALKGCVDSGYRLVMNCGEAAGQSVWHIHLHVLAGRDLEWPPG